MTRCTPLVIRSCTRLWGKRSPQGPPALTMHAALELALPIAEGVADRALPQLAVSVGRARTGSSFAASRRAGTPNGACRAPAGRRWSGRRSSGRRPSVLACARPGSRCGTSSASRATRCGRGCGRCTAGRRTSRRCAVATAARACRGTTGKRKPAARPGGARSGAGCASPGWLRGPARCVPGPGSGARRAAGGWMRLLVPEGEIVLLDQADAQAAHGRVAGDAGPDDPAADHQQVQRLAAMRSIAATCSCSGPFMAAP